MDEKINLNNTEPSCRISKPAGIILGILAALFAALIPLGGLFAMALAVACQSLLLIAEPSFAAFIPIPAAYALASVMTGDPMLALASLLFVPGAFCLRICFAKKFSLSVTLTALTVVLALSYGALIAALLKLTYGSVVGAVNEIKNQISTEISNVFKTLKELIRSQNMDESLIDFSEETVRLLKKQLLMLSPAMFVVLAEIAAYCTEKLMRLAARIFRCPFVTARKQMVTVSAGAALIFIVSYFLSSFAAGDNIVYYATENLMLMVLPFAAIAGIHSMFGKNSFFRKSGRLFLKILTVGLCVMAFAMSPLMLVMLLGLWGSAGAIGRAIMLWAIRKAGRSDDDER